MLRRQRQIRTKLQKPLDAALFGGAFLIAHWLRTFPALDPHGQIQNFPFYAWLLWVIVPLAPPILELQGFYQRALFHSRQQTLFQLAKTAAWIALAVITVLFFRKAEGARGVLLLFGPLAIGIMLLKEEVIRYWNRARLGRKVSHQRVILMGSSASSGEDTNRLEKKLTAGGVGDMDVLARVNLDTTSPSQLAELLHQTSANAVIISPRQALFGHIEQAIQVCELEGVEVWLLADFFQTRLSQTIADDLNGQPVLVFRTGPDASWQALTKSVIDFGGTLFLLLVLTLLIPVIPLAALLIKLSSPGPVLFRQQRAGRNGQPFTMLKFRTMVTNAEQLQQELAQLNEMSGPVFKVSNDPRVTPIGRFLRKYSIDELPQLWNVLRGDMSLVGPRPLPVHEVQRFDDPADRRRLSVKPGLTCLWQVSGRNNLTDFKEWVRLDLEYIDNWSLWLDVKILLRTVPAVILGSGAK
jgi:exopolysaccharide biosynthesis polyprenyl glycosylphosphotransferase